MDSSGSRTATLPGFKEYISSRTPKTAQFQRTSQQMYVPPLSPRHTFHSNSSHPDLITPSRSSPSQQPMYVSRSPPKSYSNNLSRSPPKMTPQSQTRNTTTTKKSNGTSRPTPKPLNLSKSSHVSNLGRVPQTATFPPKVNRALNLPQPPKTATFPKTILRLSKGSSRPSSRFPDPSSTCVCIHVRSSLFAELGVSQTA
jgi:hypothetical protein